jgi:hypothetical protein
MPASDTTRTQPSAIPRAALVWPAARGPSLNDDWVGSNSSVTRTEPTLPDRVIRQVSIAGDDEGHPSHGSVVLGDQACERGVVAGSGALDDRFVERSVVQRVSRHER